MAGYYDDYTQHLENPIVEHSEKSPLIQVSHIEDNNTKKWTLYSRRWYLLLVYCVLSCQQSVLWITFSPIASSAKQYYDTDDFMINLLLAWGAIIYVPFLFFGGWIMNQKGGLRRIILLGAVLCGIAGAIRCLTILNPTAWWSLPVVSIGQILNAAVGPLVMASPSKLSASWFGEHERTAVTCIATLANQLGSAIGFVYSTYVVQWTSVPFLLLLQGGFSVFIMFWVVSYFPEKPPTPPSASASVSVDNTTEVRSSSNFLSEMYKLLFDFNFMLLALVGGYATGAFNAWSGMFDIILGPLGYDATFVGWLGFSSVLAGIVGGLILGFLGNSLFVRRFKLVILVLFVLSSIFFVYFSLSLPSMFSNKSIIPSTELSIIVSVTLGGLFLGSTNPIFLS